MSAFAARYAESPVYGGGGPLSVCARRSCDNASAYRVRFDGCGLCESQGEPTCHGFHAVCVDCASHLRVQTPAWVGPIAEIWSASQTSANVDALLADRATAPSAQQGTEAGGGPA